MKKEEITRIKSYIIERFRKQMEDTDLSIRTLMENQLCVQLETGQE